MVHPKHKNGEGAFSAVKVPLRHILKHEDRNLPIINDTVVTAHKMVIHTLQFIKLYLLDHYNATGSLPTLDRAFVNACLKIQGVRGASGCNPSEKTRLLKDRLTTFYRKHYLPSIPKEEKPLQYTHMSTILNYLTVDIITMYETNVKLHYMNYIERYVNVVFEKKEKIKQIREHVTNDSGTGTITTTEKDAAIRGLCSQLRKIKHDLLNIETESFTSDTCYHAWITAQKKLVVPQKATFEKDNLYYDLQCHPQDYLPCMLYMMARVEKSDVLLYNVFPMRTTIVPKHIRLDTTTLVYLLLSRRYMPKKKKPSDKRNKDYYLRKGRLRRFEDKIWTLFFRTERRCFRRKGYRFHHMIETDGVSCSILFKKDNTIPETNESVSKESYITNLTDYSRVNDKTVVGIDPGKCDLLFCVDGDTSQANTFRYSQDRRRKETKSKEFRDLALKVKQNETVPGGKTVRDHETELSMYNRKTLDIDTFKAYLQKKNEVNAALFKLYEKRVFRKLKMNGYTLRKRSEQKMMNAFKNIFGNENEVVVCFGDFEQKKHMKFKEPTVGKGMRTLFRKNGFQTYLVDEYRTSCKCSNCEGGTCEKFLVRENPRPWRKDVRLVHGLLKCKTCSCVWNRDRNGATNIYKIAVNAIRGEERPDYLRRGKTYRCRNDIFEDTSDLLNDKS